VAAVALIALTGIAAPDRPEVTWTPPPPRTTITNPSTAGWPAPNVRESAGNTETGNVADYTF
jgi:hypothetical protein